MHFVLSYRSSTGGGFKSPLDLAHKAAMENEVKHVQAAVAYVSTASNLVLCDCAKKGIQLEVWSRHDETLPTSPRVMEWALKQSTNVSWNLMPPYFHAKVIWWHGYGVYVGSANFTDAAWNGNCEAGTVILEDELFTSGLADDLEVFFADIDSQSMALSQEIIDRAKEMEPFDIEIHQLKRQMKDRFLESEANRFFERNSLADVTKKPKRTRHRDAFLKEWQETLTILRKLQMKISVPGIRPNWVPPGAAPAIEVDQFLHAFYYDKVRKGRTFDVEGSFKENRSNRSGKEDVMIDWWKNTPTAPNEEDTVFNDWEPWHRDMLGRNKLQIMTEDEFVKTATRIHAINDHAKHRSNSSFGIKDEDEHIELDERRRLHALELYRQKNAKGWNPPRLLEYLLHGGPVNETAERLYLCAFDPDYRISRLGLSALGEFVGWGLPNHFPPRNDRTNKALRALGHDVKVRAPNKSTEQ